MIIVLSLGILFVGFLVASIVRGNDFYDDGMWLVAVIMGFIFVVALILLPVGYLDSIEEIVRYDAVKQTVEQSRNNPDVSELEVAALTMSIVEVNKDLASTQFWARHPLTNWYYSKLVLELTPIR